jgi:hypothetical protein
MNTRNFSVVLENKNVDFTVRSPSLQDQREAQKVYNQAFTDAIKSGSVVRAKLDDLLRDQGLWNDEKQARFSELQQKLLDGEKKLAKGGFSLKEAKRLALEMQNVRLQIRELIGVRTSLDNHSAEGQADNARFNYLVSVCVVYKDSDKKYFSGLEDYLNRADDPVALAGAQNLANMIYGLDNNFEKNLPENRFLQKYKFVDDKLRLIDKQGRLIDEKNRLINEDGRFINEEGKLIDKDGNLVNDKGDYLFDSQPFFDDDGQPVVPEEQKTVTSNTTTKEVDANAAKKIVEPISTAEPEVVSGSVS